MVADCAGLLNIPFFNVHSAADNMVQEYLENKFEEAQPKTLNDIVEALMTEPEYRQATRPASSSAARTPAAGRS